MMICRSGADIRAAEDPGAAGHRVEVSSIDQRDVFSVLTNERPL